MKKILLFVLAGSLITLATGRPSFGEEAKAGELIKKFKWGETQGEVLSLPDGTALRMAYGSDNSEMKTAGTRGTLFVWVTNQKAKVDWEYKEGEKRPKKPARLYEIDFSEGQLQAKKEITPHRFWEAYKGWPGEAKKELLSAIQEGRIHALFHEIPTLDSEGNPTEGIHRFEIFAVAQYQ